MNIDNVSKTNEVSPLSYSLDKARELLGAALAKKALDPVLMDLRGLTTVTDFFLIVSGSSAKHVTAVAEAVLEHARSINLTTLSAEGINEGNWALLDYGDVIVHVFRKATREFYDLEGLWSEAPRIIFSGQLGQEVEAARHRLTHGDDEYEYED